MILQNGSRKYNKYDLQNINDGEFWEYVLESEDEADKLFNEAKEQEAIDVNASYELFYQASQKIDDIFQTIKDKRTIHNQSSMEVPQNSLLRIK